MGDDTGTLADTGSQQPPLKHHRTGSRTQRGGKHCIYADISQSLRVCVREKFE